jgi:hypothetical protein
MSTVKPQYSPKITRTDRKPTSRANKRAAKRLAQWDAAATVAPTHPRRSMTSMDKYSGAPFYWASSSESWKEGMGQ